MYYEHFGMTEAPFSLTPDTGFFYDHVGHQEALNVLLVALRSGEGFIKVTGEVGTGKTLVCRKLLNMLGEGFVSAYIPNPFLNATALRMALADELGIQYARNLGQHRLLKLLNEKLISLRSEGKRVVICLDEAQALPDDSLEALRLLTNLETEKAKLLQVVLFGQPELNQRLEQRSLRQLRQRITFSYHLSPMNKKAVSGYIRHRLQVAGVRDARFFTAGACSAISKHSRGIPRLINILAHKALMAAFGQGAESIQGRHVRMAAADTIDVVKPALLRKTLGFAALFMLLFTGSALLANGLIA